MTKVSWVPGADTSDFSIHNLPYGIFSSNERNARAGVAIGDSVFDLATAVDAGLFSNSGITKEAVNSSVLNNFIALGSQVHQQVRSRLQELLGVDCKEIVDSSDKFLVPLDKVKMHMPVEVGDYTDFYSSIEHATNIGKLFRPENPLLPNWRHLPVGYHGRASSLVVSGTDIRRPKGQTVEVGSDIPGFGPCQKLDYELEMAFVVGRSTEIGESVSVKNAEEYIFGVCLFNDWSARDIQKWEYVPLGPFLGKSFASSISPWIVPMAALEPFRVPGPEQKPEVLDYLKQEKPGNFDLNLSVKIADSKGEPTPVSKVNFKLMYWSMAQQLAHHTSNGCNIRVGDMMASGTISGTSEGEYGCLLEMTRGGKQTVSLSSGEERKFLEDGDTVIMSGSAEKDGIRIGFGEVRGSILPAIN